MSSLQVRSLNVLEWSLIQKALTARARSPLGQVATNAHVPFRSPEASQRLRQRIAEGITLIQQSPVHGYVAGTIDATELLERSTRDGVLEPAELFACGYFMGTLGLLGEELRARSNSVPLLAGDFELAPKAPSLCERITRSVSSENTILDSASPDLARLRRERSSRRADFEVMLERKIKDWQSDGLLQDSFYDVMDGRYVVPVKVEQQSKIDGALFGKSNTGQSVYIEPAVLTAPNNELKQIDLSIRAEEYRILRTLSAEIAKLAPTYAPWIGAVAELDLVLAAAALSREWSLTAPIVEGDELKLLNVFHPGLKEQNINIVKNTFSIAGGGHGLLISGPNTGGKTVLLKATALASAMAAAGLFIPADAGSRVPHYADVLAFIGDEQNIAAGLSSFSAQITDMKKLLADDRKPLLIVVDEILSSTDPEEASALAQALIEEFVARGHHVMVTSHFSELSMRCRQNPRIAVAAMEFENGRPTYSLRLDELGSSHALEVAERLGVPAQILTRARSLMSTAKLDYERAQAALKQKELELEAERERVHRSLAIEKDVIQKNFEQRLRDFMAQAERKLEETVQSLTQRISAYTRQGIGLSKTSKTETRLTAAAKDAFAEVENQASEALRQATGKSLAASVAAIEAGSSVKVKSMGKTRGIVLEITGEGAAAIAKVQVGAFRFEKPLDDLETIAAAPAKKTGGLSQYNYVGIDTTPLVSSKLDLRGRRYDEALSEAERYVDQAYRSGAPSVTVVTGHGTGALKKGLKELLAALPYVREFRPERANDDGATLIEFHR